MDLDPGFPVKYLVYYLIVVAVGGTGSIAGPLIASLALGIIDVAGKHYVPELGAFFIYAVRVAMLVLRPQGLFGRADHAPSSPACYGFGFRYVAAGPILQKDLAGLDIHCAAATTTPSRARHCASSSPTASSA